MACLQGQGPALRAVLERSLFFLENSNRLYYPGNVCPFPFWKTSELDSKCRQISLHDDAYLALGLSSEGTCLLTAREDEISSSRAFLLASRRTKRSLDRRHPETIPKNAVNLSGTACLSGQNSDKLVPKYADLR
mgnify:CR=1 FL=1